MRNRFQIKATSIVVQPGRRRLSRSISSTVIVNTNIIIIVTTILQEPEIPQPLSDQTQVLVHNSAISDGEALLLLKWQREPPEELVHQSIEASTEIGPGLADAVANIEEVRNTEGVSSAMTMVSGKGSVIEEPKVNSTESIQMEELGIRDVGLD